MKRIQSDIQSSMSRARGLGSAHEGVGHWWSLRLAAVVLIPLMLWLVWAVMQMPDWSYDEFTFWLAQPVNAILMILAVIFSFYHAALGSREIVEDYVHHEGFKLFKLIAMQFCFFAAAVACIFSILKIAFVG